MRVSTEWQFLGVCHLMFYMFALQLLQVLILLERDDIKPESF